MKNQNGIIGRSGKWYECKKYSHLSTADRNWEDGPFLICRFFAFEAELCLCDNPSKSQLEVAFEWCTANELVFEEVKSYMV